MQATFGSWRALLGAHMERRALANRKREADALAAAASMAEDGLVNAAEAAAEAERAQRPRFDIPPSLAYLYRTIGIPRKTVAPRKQLRVWAVVVFQHIPHPIQSRVLNCFCTMISLTNVRLSCIDGRRRTLDSRPWATAVAAKARTAPSSSASGANNASAAAAAASAASSSSTGATFLTGLPPSIDATAAAMMAATRVGSMAVGDTAMGGAGAAGARNDVSSPAHSRTVVSLCANHIPSTRTKKFQIPSER